MTTATAQTLIRSFDVPVGDGWQLRFNEAGIRRDGEPTLVFLHGSGPGVSGLANWRAVLDGMGGDFHCLAPDILGFADSSHPDPAPQGFLASAEQRIERLLVALDALGVERAVFVGNSMGGIYTLRIAQLRPELVEKMVLMGSGGKPDLPILPGLVKLVTFYDNPTPEAMAELLLLFVHDKQAFGPQIAEVARQRMKVAGRDDVRRSHLGTFAPGQFLTFSEQELTALTAPALVIHGADDVIVPIDSSYYLAEHLPNADLYVMGKCGHWTQVEQARRFQAILRDFVTGEL